MHQNIIVLDSNFILLPFQFKIDYLNEIRDKLEGKLEFLIFKQVLNELKAKRRREPNATKFSKFLNSGLTYLEKNNTNFNIEYVEEVKNKLETTDDFLLRKSLELRKEGKQVFLATNDSELRKEARNLDINTIFLRQEKYLSVERA